MSCSTTRDRVIVMSQGRVVADGTPQVVGSDPAVVNAYLGIRRDEGGDGSVTVSGAEILRVEGVYGGYVEEADILRGVDIAVSNGEIVSVVGPNGAGKSTLIKIIIGLLRSRRGRISFEGRDITRTAPHNIVRQGVAYVPQRANVFPTMTVEENLELGALGIGIRRPKERLPCPTIFPRLAERRRQAAGTLSGGERQMVAIARALIREQRLLILDEPSAGLSPAFVDLIFDRIASIKRETSAVLMVEQNAVRALEIST